MEVSVIIPFFNREKFLQHTLKSVYEQNYRPIELILVDNNSTDDSLKIAETFAENYSDTQFSVKIVTEEKPGATAARNKGLSLAQGDFVYFFDSDDYMSPDYISWALETILKDKADAVATPTCMYWKDGRTKARKYLKHLTVEGQILTGQLATQSVFYRSEFVRQLNGWNDSMLYWNDWEMGIRLLLSDGKISWYKDKVFHSIFQHDESITGHSYSTSFSNIFHAFSLVSKLLQQHSLLDSVWRSIAMREAIIAGQLAREQRTDLSKQCLVLIEAHRYTWLEKILFRVLYSYVSWGGKGAWKIAKMFV